MPHIFYVVFNGAPIFSYRNIIKDNQYDLKKAEEFVYYGMTKLDNHYSKVTTRRNFQDNLEKNINSDLRFELSLRFDDIIKKTSITFKKFENSLFYEVTK